MFSYTALLYASGDVGEVNKAKAFELYTKAAEQGHPLAQHNLGCMYDVGDGIEVDKKKAFEWFMKAAEQGDHKAQCNVGICHISCRLFFLVYLLFIGNFYLTGEHDVVPKDEKKAFSWYKKSAKESVEAQYQLGMKQK